MGGGGMEGAAIGRSWGSKAPEVQYLWLRI